MVFYNKFFFFSFLFFSFCFFPHPSSKGGEHTCGAVFGLKYPIAPVSPSSHSDTAVVLVSLFGGFSLILISIVICLRFERQRFCCV